MGTPMKSAANPPLTVDPPWTVALHDVDADKKYDVTTVTDVVLRCTASNLISTLTVELIDAPSVNDLADIDPKKRLTGLYLGFQSGAELGPFYFDPDNGIEPVPAKNNDDFDRIIWRLHGPFRYRGDKS